MIFHIPELRSLIRSAFNQESSDTGILQNDDLDYAINEAYMSRAADLINTHEGYFEEVFPITLIAEQDAYDLPSVFSAGERAFVKTTVIQRLVGNSWFPLAYRRKYNNAQIATGSQTGDGYIPTYHYRGRQVIFDPPPDSADPDTTRMIYTFMPARLRSSTVAAGASTTTAEALLRMDDGADPRDDYYNSQKVIIVAGTSNAKGQIRTITDYDGDTKIATLDSAWTNTDSDTSTTNPKEGETYSLLIDEQFPELFHELLALDACMSGYLRERASSLVISDFASHRRVELAEKFKNLLENRTDQPKFTRPWHIELD